MKELTCIVCPIGCPLSVEEADGELRVSGNRCPRGAAYAAEEIRAPKRVVTATCRLGPASSCADQEEGDGGASRRSRARRRGLCDPRRLPVRTSGPCPKERVAELLADIYSSVAAPPVRRGDILIEDWKGTGIDVVATRTLD